MFSQTKISLLVLISLVSVSCFAGCDAKKAAKEDTAKQSVEKPEASGDAADTSEVETSEPKVEAADATPAKDEVAENSERSSSAKPAKPAEPAEPAASAGDGFEVAVAKGGALVFKAPSSWKKVKPRSFVVEYEISVPKSEGDAADGRLTIMGAGGNVQANIDRWYGQYTQPDGSKTADNSTVTESEVAGCEVTWVDIEGTLMDRPGGPMAGGKVVERENYRTLASIVQAGEHGQYFIKLYGPVKTINDNEASFRSFVQSLVIAKD
jgi:hypothetical protein